MRGFWPICALLLLFPIAASADFSRDLFFGIMNDPDVTRLQEFLREERVYDGPVTGNFLTLTREGVKNFQRRENIEPVAGYFGPLTRGRANEITSQKSAGGVVLPAGSRVEQIAFLQAKIAELTRQLADLQAKLVEETAVAASPPPTPAEVTPLPEPEPVKEVRIEETFDASAFPESEISPFKIGEFSVSNSTVADVLFAQIEVRIIDNMESLGNRSNKVYFLLRDGKTTSDKKISSTEFTFHKDDPRTKTEPHKVLLKLPFDIKLTPGEKRTISLWVELFKYVRVGALTIETIEISTTDPKVEGGFTFLLTRELTY